MKSNLKSKLKLLITFFTLFLLLFSSLCFATDSNAGIMPISEEEIEQGANIQDSDLYVDNEITDIKNTINGNVFASASTLNIDPKDNGGIIEGNLFVAAKNVNIKSNVTYSDTEKDDIGNPAVSIDKACTISGNVFVSANKLVIEPGCKIYGDLYVCAKEVELSQGAIIYGNVFIASNKLTINSEIGGSLYATASSFDMQYFGFISRDLHLSAETATLNGYIYRNSFVEAKNITTNDKFINEKDFNITDADCLTFSGEVKGNSKINAKNIDFKNKNNDKDLICKINGNLSYSSKQEIQIPDGVVSKEAITYSKYVPSESSLSSIWDFVLDLITTLVCIFVIYFLVSKFAPNYLSKISNISGGMDLLKLLGIGFGLLILIPIISILLFLSHVGSILGIILLFIYIILMIIAKPIFVISIATFTKEKLSIKMNTYLYMLAITIILSLIALIPYVGFIVLLLINFTGFGIITKNLRVK